VLNLIEGYNDVQMRTSMLTKPWLPATGFLLTLLPASLAIAAGEVQTITNFGANPSGIGMYLYTPSAVTSRPAVVVNVHACHGKGTDVCGPSGAFAQQADKWGFLVVCPSAVSSDGCWDVHSESVLTHDGGGDATGIVSMVKWVIQNKNADPDRVYVAGHSSGGMMTNVMLGSYPDIFKAGAAYAGVPFACYAQGAVDSLGWNANCAQGKVSMGGKEWGDLVRGAYPDFSRPRPRIQIWHGTKDDVVFFQNFKEELKQWTNVFGLSETPTSSENNAIQTGWIRTRYADSSGVVQVEAIEETGQPHNLVVDASQAIHFFGLDAPAPDGGTKDAAADARADSGGTGGNTGGASTSTGAGGAGGATSGSGGTGGRDDRDAGRASGGETGTGSSGPGGRTGGASGGRGGSGSSLGGQTTSSGAAGLANSAVASSQGTAGTGGGGASAPGSSAGSGGTAGASSASVATTPGSASSGKRGGGCSLAPRPGAQPGLWLLALLLVHRKRNLRR
jgi:acetylxylan esterase